MIEQLEHFINGELVDGKSGRYSNVYNPSTGEVSKQLPLANTAEVNDAIEVAKAAFPAWRDTPALKRARIMFKFKELLERDMPLLKKMIANEHGKVLSDAQGEITRGMEVVEFVCGIPHLLKGSFSENVGTKVDSHDIRQPLGVVAGITPFNFPAMVPMWMFPVALACGNTFILKPSEKDPSCPLHIAKLLTEAGLPDGVFNVVNGDKESVDALLDSPDIEAISFVGSTPIAEYIYTKGSANGKRVQALGGAKNHMVVMPDADLNQAADALIGAAFGSAGERCMAISVAVVIGDETADALIEKLQTRMTDINVQGSEIDGADMGPLISEEHKNKVTNYINTGVSEGAKLLTDGRNYSVEDFPKGYFIGPTLFDQVSTDMRIYQEEIFGPVLCIVRADHYETALKMLNDHEFGNGAAIFTRDGDTARDFTNRAKIGMIGVNIPIPVPMAFHSFGGWKRSIFGDHSVHGPEGIHFYTRLKTVTTRWPEGIHASSQFDMPTM